MLFKLEQNYKKSKTNCYCCKNLNMMVNKRQNVMDFKKLKKNKTKNYGINYIYEFQVSLYTKYYVIYFLYNDNCIIELKQ